ncbi:hypothetical protein GQ57_25505 [Burkholderia sp. MSh2]|uniref:Uncharacterized protein n=1 Tax=Burkholderia paludis TaxID=1506587 RepID=A0A6P2R5T4_9BURK|nr:hypothetical protein GQ57_25505 [Burkholderia sp. MSh2]CAB3767893.1 hypothetical protein LMG30113_05572 [Burkholderia paludis]VWC30201.1 hypothetical protein BPA30113_06244 [Burkholderia paludis]
MSDAGNKAIERLLQAIADDSDDCGAMYEEIGRVVVHRLMHADRDALRAVAGAWIASDEAQAALVDLDVFSPDLGAAKGRAERADGMLRDAVRNAVFKAPT